MPIATSPVRDPSPPLPTSKPQSILRGSTTKRRRTELSDSDRGDDNLLQSDPAKRRKVAFEFEPTIRIVDEHGEKSIILIREEVRHAITQHKTGDNEEYNDIIHVFGTEPNDEGAVSDSLLGKYLLGFVSNASMLNRTCADLVHAVLGMKWLLRDGKLVQKYNRFLSHLAIASPGYVPEIMKMLVENFAHLSTSAGRIRAGHDRAGLYDRIHTALAAVINAVPAATAGLLNTLSSTFPFIEDSKRAHITYVRNLLRLADNFPEIRSSILELIIDRSLNIDVQLQVDVENLEEDIGDLIEHEEGRKLDDRFHHAGDESDAESDSDDDSEDIDTEELRIKKLKLFVEKLDAMLDLCFKYCDDALKKPSSAEAQSAFDLLISQFRNAILRTYRSRHTQFLLFHFAQSSSDLATRFTDSCLEILTDKNRSDVLRVSAAAYIASFIARGARIETETVVYAFESLASFLDNSRKLLEPACRVPELRKYGPYYAAVQAIVYIFCFRWRDLLNDLEDCADEEDDELMDGRELTWAPGIKEAFTKNFNCKLNPLKVCAPEIIEEFARLARQLQFLYIYPILEANKRLRLTVHSTLSYTTNVSRETALTGLHGERYHQLDAYFPFDPFHLPISKKWIAGEFNEWKGVSDHSVTGGAEQQDSDVYDGEELIEQDDLLDAGIATPDDDA